MFQHHLKTFHASKMCFFVENTARNGNKANRIARGGIYDLTDFSAYSVGVIPKCFLKAVEKYV